MNKKSFPVAFCGVMTALTIIFLTAASFIPGIELTLYCISSLFIAAAIVETQPKYGIFTYVASLIAGLLIVPNKVGLLPFAIIFGPYVIIKFYIEKLHKPLIQVILKAVFFALSWSAGILFFSELLVGDGVLSSYKLPSWVLIIGGILILFVYDYILTFIISYYMKRRKKVPQPFKLDRE